MSATTPGPSRLIAWIIAASVSALCVAINAWLWQTTDDFSSAFDQFGAEIPFLTQAFLSSYTFVIIPLFFTCFCMWIAWKSPKPKRNLLLSSIVAVLEVPAFIFIMYLPVFALGAKVS